MATLEQRIKEELNEQFNYEDQNVEILNETVVKLNGAEKFHVVDKDTAVEVLGEELLNYNGFKAKNFVHDFTTYYFVKQ